MHKILICFYFLLNITILNAQIKVAVLDFENTSSIEKYNGFGKAMSNMLLTDLKNNIHPRKISFLERTQLNKILSEQQLQGTKSFDKNTAVTFGKLAGVKYVILGSVYVLDGICNLNSRMVDVETSEIIYAKESNGKITEWLNLKTKLAEDLSSELNNPIEIEDAYTNLEVNEGTITQYSKVIELLEKGELEEASKLISILTSIQPDFKYLEELKFDIELLKEQVKKNTSAININKSEIKENKENINTLNKSGDLIIDLNTLEEYVNNLNSDLIKIKEKRNLLREVFLKFNTTEILKYLDKLYLTNSESDIDVLTEILNEDIKFIENLKSEIKKGLYAEIIIREIGSKSLSDSETVIKVYEKIEILCSMLYDAKEIKQISKFEFINYYIFKMLFININTSNKDFFINHFKKMIDNYEEIFDKNIFNFNSLNFKNLAENIFENEELKDEILYGFKTIIDIASMQKIANDNSLKINFFDLDNIRGNEKDIKSFNINFKSQFDTYSLKIFDVLPTFYVEPNLYNLGIDIKNEYKKDYLYTYKMNLVDEIHENTLNKIFFYNQNEIKKTGEIKKYLINNRFYEDFKMQFSKINFAYNLKISCEENLLNINSQINYFNKVKSLYQESGRPLCNGFEKILEKYSFLDEEASLYLNYNKNEIIDKALIKLGFSYSDKEMEDINFVISNDFKNGSHIHITDFYNKNKFKEFTVINIDQELLEGKRLISNSFLDLKHIEIQYFDFLEDKTELLLATRYSNSSYEYGPLQGVQKYVTKKYDYINSINDKLIELKVPEEIIIQIFNIYSENPVFFKKYFSAWFEKWGSPLTFNTSFELFNNSFEIYSGENSDLSLITWGIMVNYFLNNYYSNKELTEKFIQNKVLLNDYRVANELNLLTGLIIFSTKSNRKNTGDLLKKIEKLDLNYEFKSGDWKMLKLRDMIILDIENLFSKKIINLTLKNKILNIVQ